MGSDYDADFTAVADLFAEVYGAAVTYHRADNSVAITAERSSHDHEIINAEGMETVARSWGFLITSADLVIAAATITPRPGDRIKETISGVVHTFTVERLETRDCYEWADLQKTQVIVHTRLTGTA